MLFRIRNRISLAAAILLAVLLTGCTASKLTPQARMERDMLQMEQTDQTSVISGIRTGIKRQGIFSVANSFECTDDGVYYMCNTGEGSYLYFGDHDTNTMVKLCSRPDCDHSGEDCDAYFENAVNICYYNGYLYTVQNMAELWRISLDGSQRAFILDGTSVDSKYTGSFAPTIWNGVFSYFLTYPDETGATKLDAFYLKLDGSMKEPARMDSGYFSGNDGVNFIMNATVDEAGQTGVFMYHWDPVTNTRTRLIERSTYQNGYWGTDAGYVLDGNNAICRLNYEDGSEEVLFATGLEGNYIPRFFPDCIVLMRTEHTEAETCQTELLFYDWSGKPQGSVTLKSTAQNTGVYLCGETKDRIMLTTASNGLPEYYLEKSDFGTGNIALHAYEVK